MKHLLLLAACAALTAHAATIDVTAEQAEAQTTLAAMQAAWPEDQGVKLIALPAIDNKGDITAAVSTTSSDNAAAIQTAINQANQQGGGRVIIPAGTYLTGPLTMKSNVCLHLAAGCTLKLLPYGTYPGTQALDTDCDPFINATAGAVNDVIIEGENQQTSIIDGQGADWWPHVKPDKGYDKYTGKRPALIRLGSGQRHLFRHLTLRNSPGTNLTLGQSGKASHMTAHHITIQAPASDDTPASHNTDGIPIWGPYANIYDCDISTGDDNIVCDSDARYIRANRIHCGTGHGMSFGSYTERMNHIIYENITFQGTEAGFRLKTSRGRSGNNTTGTNGAVSDIICRNATMTETTSHKIKQPIMITSWYDADPAVPDTAAVQTIADKTPEFCNITFQNITATTTSGSDTKRGHGIYISALPESYTHHITFDNVRVQAHQGVFLANCRDITFSGGTLITKGNATTVAPYDYNTNADGTTPASTFTGTFDGTTTTTTPDTGDDTDTPQAETKTVVIAPSTYKGADKEQNSPWPFQDINVTNASGKQYAAGYTNTNTVKYSTGVTFTIPLPDGYKATAVKFEGYGNSDNTPCYLAELAGTTYTATDYSFAGRVKTDTGTTYPTTTHTITFANPVAGSLTLKPAGAQACWRITLTLVRPATTTLALPAGDIYATTVTTTAIDFTGDTPITAYALTQAATTGQLTLTRLQQPVPAGTPLLLHAATPGATATLPVPAQATAPAANLFLAGDGQSHTGACALTGAGNQFYFATVRAGVAIPQGRAYFTTTAANARFAIDQLLSTTAITTLNAATLNAAPRKYIDQQGLHIGRCNALGQRER